MQCLWKLIHFLGYLWESVSCFHNLISLVVGAHHSIYISLNRFVGKMQRIFQNRLKRNIIIFKKKKKKWDYRKRLSSLVTDSFKCMRLCHPAFQHFFLMRWVWQHFLYWIFQPLSGNFSIFLLLPSTRQILERQRTVTVLPNSINIEWVWWVRGEALGEMEITSEL